jgi:hypothetical protein
MKKEYEAPFCKVINVEQKDILTNSSTSKYQAAVTQEKGDFSGGAFIEWGNW